MSVEVIVEDPAWDTLDLATLADGAVTATLAHLGLPDDCDVAILACDDARIADLNADYRGKPTPTNVLSWPSGHRAATADGADPLPPADPELGDIAIAFGVCRAEAAGLGKALGDHVTHLIVHGALHLLGYDHTRDGDAALMEGHERDILAKLGISDPYGVEDTPDGKAR